VYAYRVRTVSFTGQYFPRNYCPNSLLSFKSHTQVLTQEEFVHLPPGEVDSQQDAEQDSEYIRE